MSGTKIYKGCLGLQTFEKIEENKIKRNEKIGLTYFILADVKGLTLKSGSSNLLVDKKNDAFRIKNCRILICNERAFAKKQHFCQKGIGIVKQFSV